MLLTAAITLPSYVLQLFINFLFALPSSICMYFGVISHCPNLAEDHHHVTKLVIELLAGALRPANNIAIEKLPR